MNTFVNTHAHVWAHAAVIKTKIVINKSLMNAHEHKLYTNNMTHTHDFVSDVNNHWHNHTHHLSSLVCLMTDSRGQWQLTYTLSLSQTHTHTFLDSVIFQVKSLLLTMGIITEWGPRVHVCEWVCARANSINMLSPVCSPDFLHCVCVFWCMMSVKMRSHFTVIRCAAHLCQRKAWPHYSD